MTTLSEVCSQNKTYICDSCGAKFKASEVVMRNAPLNIDVLTPIQPFIFVDKNNVIKGGGTSAMEGDRVLTCPKCKTVHPHGFDTV